MTPEYILSQLSFLEKLYYTPPPSYNTTQSFLSFAFLAFLLFSIFKAKGERNYMDHLKQQKGKY